MISFFKPENKPPFRGVGGQTIKKKNATPVWIAFIFLKIN